MGKFFGLGNVRSNIETEYLKRIKIVNAASIFFFHFLTIAFRSGAAVGVINGLLYSVGGHDGPLVRKSVECYNPDRDEWTQVSEMNYCRRNAGVVAHNGLLYVIGGDDGSSNLQSVEAYSPKTDLWTVLPAAMSLGRSYTGVCVIDKPESI